MGDLIADIRRRLISVSPYALEDIVADLWNSMGYHATSTSNSGDRGIDVVARAAETDKIEAIQVKRHQKGNKIGSPEVRRYATLYLQDFEIDEVVLVTTSSFTDEAIVLAHDLDVRLIHGRKLAELVHEHGGSATQPDDPAVDESGGNASRTVDRIVLSGDVPGSKRRVIASELAGTELTGEEELEVRGFNITVVRVSPRARQRTPCTITSKTSFVWQ